MRRLAGEARRSHYMTALLADLRADGHEDQGEDRNRQDEVGRRARDDDQGALPDRLDSYNFLNRFDVNDMFCPAFIAHIDSQLPLQQKQQRYKACRSADAVDCMMYLDWKFTLADNDLVKVSSMCQLAGVEVRYPLFEKEVVDFSCKVSAGIKAPGQKLRDFYKRSFTGFLPDATLSKSKHGFGLPFGVWMKQQPKLQQITADSLASLKQPEAQDAGS